jgi:hypothetical protein
MRITLRLLVKLRHFFLRNEAPQPFKYLSPW